jgi:hypothetical protein
MRWGFARRQAREPGASDEGMRGALLFATVVGAFTGTIAMALFIGGSALVSHFGGYGTGTHALLIGSVAWLTFWVGLSAGIAGGLFLGVRVAARMGPKRGQHELFAPDDEELAAVREAEQLLHRASRSHDNT